VDLPPERCRARECVAIEQRPARTVLKTRRAHRRRFEGTAIGTTISYGGEQDVQPGGTASGTTIDSGGLVVLEAGAVVSGGIEFGRPRRGRKPLTVLTGRN
jgi:autotransporter passenger strand-loop-strand repeat protein